METGTHRDNSGNIQTWTADDLDKAVKNYSPQHREAPVVIGEPKETAPAYGWVEQLKREGEGLYAKIKSCVVEFLEMYNKGLFSKRFVSFYPDRSLKHIGFIGQKPSIQGLQLIQFTEGGNTMTVEFSTNNDAGETLHQKTMELLKSPRRFDNFGRELNEKLTYTQALDIVMQENPDLARQYLESLRSIGKRSKIIKDPSIAGTKLQELVQQKMKDNKALSFSEAFIEVQRENPQLAIEYSQNL